MGVLSQKFTAATLLNQMKCNMDKIEIFKIAIF